MTAIDFLRAMLEMAPPDGRVLLTQYPGDPNSDIAEKWRVKPLNVDLLEQRHNIYVTLSAFRLADDRRFHRTNETFNAALAFVIDDVGTKVDAKVIDLLPPTMLVETSEGNYQAAYLFHEPLRQFHTFNELVEAFVQTHCGGVDPGMKGVTRVWRPGIGVNGKTIHARNGKPWVVRVTDIDLTRRYSVEQLVEGFGLVLRPPPVRKRICTTDGQVADRIEQFLRVVELLKQTGMMSRGADDCLETWIGSKWIYITCPWIDYHSQRANTGTAIRGPAPLEINEVGVAVGNDWNGAFKCHHGHCQDKDWSDLVDHLNETITEAANDCR